MVNYDIIERCVTVEEFNSLRLSVGWTKLNHESVSKALDSSLYAVCTIVNNQIVGMGRVVGDGGLYYYIQDLIVETQFQGLGIGNAMLTKIIKFLENNISEGAFIGLMAAKGKELFYKKFGFIERPNKDFGPGMCIPR